MPPAPYLSDDQIGQGTELNLYIYLFYTLYERFHDVGIVPLCYELV